MRMSKMLIPTTREVPAEAEIVSHQLMLRAGLIRKETAGVYTYMPLGLRVIQKIETIIRQEMNAKGGQELLLPIVQPAELWQESGRWDVYGEEMFRLKDRHNREFCLGPTHEEIITALVRSEVRSYRQLPLLLYQIQNKYRDEIRPRFGLMRGREFIMKDLYSFDRDEAGLKESYAKMYDAYSRIFDRCGVTYRVVEADPGQIGGGMTHEFMVLADSGEAGLVFCDKCDYAADVEQAETSLIFPGDEPVPGPREERSTPGLHTVEEVAEFLGVPPARMIKTLIYETADGPVAVVLRGDHQVNEVKLGKTLGTDRFRLADPGTVERITGAPVGFAGPMGLDIPLLVDRAVTAMSWGITGGNRADVHLVNVIPGKDFSIDRTADLRVAQAGDHCPRCQEGVLQAARGIEAGQIFQLGTKYSKAMGATYADENGEEKLVVMGCYGIGVGRTMAASIEQNHDDNGIIWPASIAPMEVTIVPVGADDPAQMEAAAKLEEELTAKGIEVLLDDRPERAGVKFKDADLIGIPFRVTIGPKSLAEGMAEVKHRQGGQVEKIPLGQAVSRLVDLVNAGRRTGA